MRHLRSIEGRLRRQEPNQRAQDGLAVGRQQLLPQLAQPQPMRQGLRVRGGNCSVATGDISLLLETMDLVARTNWRASVKLKPRF
jgi:hypothetical protein